MKNLIFNIIIRILNIGFVKKSRLYAIASIYFKKTKELRSLKEKVNFLFYAFFHLRLYSAKTKASAIYKLAKGIRIHTDDDLFFYSIDTFAYLFNKGKVIDNCSLDYSEILSKSLNDFYITEHSKHKFVIENNKTVDAINLYLNRCINQIKQSSIKNKDNIISYLQEILTGEASCFASALQRILFFNQFMWQTGHNLVGLNRLDFILDKYIDKQMTDDDLFNYLKSFCTVLHKYYWFKSAALMGDTGQIIILGGKDANSNYFENRLTHIFIKVIKELNLPDPKILLRVSKETPENLWKEALDCVSTGVGSPLFSNDDVIIPALLQFGYQEKDATNYITSACWEPIPAECYEQNNLFDIFYIEPLNQLIKTESFENIKTFDELMNGYFDLLESQIKETEKKLDAINWEQDPLLSMFNTSCREALTDVAEGGAKYNNFGILSVSLANTVNSLLNIEELVFKKNKYTLSDVKQCCLNNFNDRDDILLTLKNKEKYFGRNEIEIQNFTNRILSKINLIVEPYRNKFNGKLKFGLSSPNYLSKGFSSSASFDGRKEKESFSVHISADQNNGYTEIMNFASHLEYKDALINGNVVDIMVSPNIIKENAEKFAFFVHQSMLNGVFQMQMNVVSSKILIEARKNPDAFPHLIVRVWGFSSYFNDLPDEYKDYLIQRALQNERVA